MPVHNWLPVPIGLYHHFHQSWAVILEEGLNNGVLPPGYFALVDQRAIAHYVTQQTHREVFASRANRVAVRNSLGELAALIEIVSPGNKNSKHAIRAFVFKTTEFIANGANLLVIDLFPPTPRDPHGIHKAIWDELHEEPFELPKDKRLTVAAYSADVPITAYVEPIGVDDSLPGMPLYLEPGNYIPVPLEETYQRTWEKCPEEMKEIVLGANAPEAGNN